MKVVVAIASLGANAAIGMLVVAQPDMELVGEATDLTGLLVQVKQNQPDVIVLDWDGFGHRIGDLQQLLELFGTPPAVVALSVHDNQCERAMEAGVSRFAHKGSPPQHLLDAIRQSPSVTEKTAPHFPSNESNSS